MKDRIQIIQSANLFRKMAETDRIQKFYLQKGKNSHSQIQSMIYSPEAAAIHSERKHHKTNMRSEFSVHKAGTTELSKLHEPRNQKVLATDRATNRSAPRPHPDVKGNIAHQDTLDRYIQNRTKQDIQELEEKQAAAKMRKQDRLKELIEKRYAHDMPIASQSHEIAVTQFPKLPVFHNQAKETRGSGSRRVLESPNLQKYEDLAKRYGLNKPKKQPSLESNLDSKFETSNNFLSQAVTGSDNQNQNTNRSNLLKKMTAQSNVTSIREVQPISTKLTSLQLHEASETVNSQAQDWQKHDQIRKLEAASRLRKEKLNQQVDKFKCRSMNKVVHKNLQTNVQIADAWRLKQESVSSQPLNSQPRIGAPTQSLKFRNERKLKSSFKAPDLHYVIVNPEQIARTVMNKRQVIQQCSASRNSSESVQNPNQLESELQKSTQQTSDHLPQLQYDDLTADPNVNKKTASSSLKQKLVQSNSMHQTSQQMGSQSDKTSQSFYNKKDLAENTQQQKKPLERQLKLPNNIYLSTNKHNAAVQKTNNHPQKVSPPITVIGVADQKSRQFQPVRNKSKIMERRTLYARGSSSQGFQSFPAENISEKSRLNLKSPYGEKQSVDLAQLVRDQVRLPDLQGGSAVQSEAVITGVASRKQSQQISENGSQGSLFQNNRNRPVVTFNTALHMKGEKKITSPAKSFETRTLLQPSFQPILQEQKKKREEEAMRQSGNLRKILVSPALLESFDKNEKKTKQARTPFIAQQSSMRQHGTPTAASKLPQSRSSMQARDEQQLKTKNTLKQVVLGVIDPANATLYGKDLPAAPFETPASGTRTVINLVDNLVSDWRQKEPVEWRQDDIEISNKNILLAQIQSRPQKPTKANVRQIDGLDSFCSNETVIPTAPTPYVSSQTNSMRMPQNASAMQSSVNGDEQDSSTQNQRKYGNNSLGDLTQESRIHPQINQKTKSKFGNVVLNAVSIYSKQLRRVNKDPNTRVQRHLQNSSLKSQHNRSLSKPVQSLEALQEKEVLLKAITTNESVQKMDQPLKAQQQFRQSIRNTLASLQKSQEDFKKQKGSKDGQLISIYSSGKDSRRKISVPETRKEDAQTSSNAYADEWKTMDFSSQRMRDTDPQERDKQVISKIRQNPAMKEQLSRESNKQRSQHMEDPYLSPKKFQSAGLNLHAQRLSRSKLHRAQAANADLIFIEEPGNDASNTGNGPSSDTFISGREKRSVPTVLERELGTPEYLKQKRQSHHSNVSKLQNDRLKYQLKDQTPKSNMFTQMDRVTKARLIEQRHRKGTSLTNHVEQLHVNSQSSEATNPPAKTNGQVRIVDLTSLLTKISDEQDTPKKNASKLTNQIAKKSKNHQQQQAGQLQKRPSQPFTKQFKLEDFDQLGILGRGSFGQVKLVRHRRSNELFALKQILKERIRGDKHIQHVKNEKQILKDITNELQQQNTEASFFVNFVESLQDDTNLYLLLEYLPGGELLQQIREHMSLTMENAMFYLAEVLVAIQQLHEKNVIYRDLKPENILLDKEGHIKLIDFGFSKQLNSLRSEKVRTNCGTPAYAAPEVLISSEYNYKADIWSFGILICELLGGFTPFGAKAMEIEVAQDGFGEGSPGGGLTSMPPHKIIEMVQTGRIILPKNLTPLTRDLVRKILVADPNVRLEIKDIMQHKFFEGVDWQKVARKQTSPPHVPSLTSEDRLLNQALGSAASIERDPMSVEEIADEQISDGVQQLEFSSMTNQRKQTVSKASKIANETGPWVKRAANPSKILGDYHLTKINAIFEDF